MGWRIHRNESNYSDATLLAWEIILPYKYLTIIENDERKVKELIPRLKELFTTYELHVVGKRIKNKIKR